jgi:hypothetical protein
VHFLRFQLPPGDIAALKRGADLAIGVDHPQYQATITAVGSETRVALVADLAGAQPCVAVDRAPVSRAFSRR